MEKTKTTKFLGSFSLSKNGGGAGGTTNYEDLTNKPKVNGVTLSGNKTSADLGITTLTPFPSTWPTTGKFEDLLAAIREDTIAVKGASFLGEVTFDDLPANLGNAEIKIEILEGTTSATKVIHSVITSGNREPYRWEYTSWNSGNSNSGWISFQLPLTAGDGISIENNVISTTGGADVPEDVYTQSNLLAGNGVEIVNEPVEGGIDEYTLSCFHLDETDNNAVDEVTGISLPVTSDTTLHKFGAGCAMFALDRKFPWSVSMYESFSFDYWLYRKSDRSFALGFKRPGQKKSFTIVIDSGNSPIKLQVNDINYDTGVYVENKIWSHIYAYYNSTNQSFHLFLNGKEIYSVVSTHTFSGLNIFTTDGYTTSRVDEIRISKCIRWTEDFEPPTKPYSVAVPTGNKVINNTGVTSINTKKGNVTLTADDINVTYTHEGAETTTSIKEFADTVDHNIENLNSLIPVNAYTAENLIAGKNITIEEVLPEGGIDNHTLACFHCDGNIDDATNNKYITSNKPFTDSEFYNVISPKFGSASLTPGDGGYDRIFTNETILLSTFTLDFWMKKSRSSVYVTMSLPDNYVFNQDTWKFYKADQPGTILISSISTPDNSNWHHFAFTYEPNKICIFIDGILQGDCKRTSDNFYLGAVNFNGTYDLDEIRFSDIVRYPENFVPPTQAYSVAVPTGNKVINNTITKTSQLTNDSGFLTSIPENLVTSDNVTKIVKLTQAEYNALETKDDSTFYAIVG